MSQYTYRYRVNAVAVIASYAFAGANLFVGPSMGVYWLRLDLLDFSNGFEPQFQRLLLTMIPLLLLTLLRLVLSARLVWTIVGGAVIAPD
ncbi:MAG: hypothetical protein AAGI28_17135 [Pseudomonadota bacterium]